MSELTLTMRCDEERPHDEQIRRCGTIAMLARYCELNDIECLRGPTGEHDVDAVIITVDHTKIVRFLSGIARFGVVADSFNYLQGEREGIPEDLLERLRGSFSEPCEVDLW